MPGTPFTLRVRTKTGVIKIANLTETSCISDLKTAIFLQANLDSSQYKILKGYPPKHIDYSNDCSTLTSHNISNGELLTIEEGSTTKSPVTAIATNNTVTTTSSSQSKTEGVLLRKVVPANNSCLFTSVHYVMNNGDYDLECQESMRQYIAQTVKSDTINFNEAILGKTNSEYCKWILVVSLIQLALATRRFSISYETINIKLIQLDSQIVHSSPKWLTLAPILAKIIKFYTKKLDINYAMKSQIRH